MSKNIFKVGDKVRIIEDAFIIGEKKAVDYDSSIKSSIGEVGTVSKLERGYVYVVDLPTDCSPTTYFPRWSYEPHQLELITN